MGSQTTRVVVGEFLKGEKNPRIIGLGESPTLGMRHGYVVNGDLAVSSLKSALAVAEKTSNIKIRKAFVSVGGVSLRGDTSSGMAMISKADGEVTSLDVKKALQDCEDNLNLGNKKIIQVFPQSFRLDGKDVLGRLEGMRGTKLEVKTLFMTYSVQHLEDLLEVVALCGVEPLDVVASPIAGSYLALSDRQKVGGVALVNIGSETTSVAVFENGTPISLYTFSIGSEDITNDIALGFKISLETAERLKLGTSTEEFSKKKLEEIVEARLSDIFELIENHFKKIKRSELLPAGVVFIGGGASVPGLAEFAKSVLKLPASVGTTEIFGNTKTKLRDSAWLTVLGLILYGKDGGDYSEGSFFSIFKDIKSSLKSGLKQLMP